MVCIALLLALVGPQPAETFTISLDRIDGLTAHVEGAFKLVGDTLFATEGTGREPHVWAEKIRHLRLRDSAGAAIPVDTTSTAVFLVRSPYRGAVRISYDVDLSFTHRPWPGGNQRAGIARDSALYVITKALFVVADTSAAPARVSFVVPQSWQIATPWSAAPASVRVYDVANYQSLSWNSVVLGRFQEVSIKSGNFALRLALIGDVRREAPIVSSVLSRVVRTYIRLFPNTPPTTDLLTFFYYNRDDGEAFAQSSAFVTEKRLTPGGAQLWANTLAHELFHFWNPFLIKPVEPIDEQAWFIEGFTEYYANMTLVRTGVTSFPLFLGYAGRHLGSYSYFNDSPLFDSMTIRRAGVPDKTKGRFGVYDGGWTVALALDLMIREHSHGKQTLDELMRRMFDRFPPSSRGYSYQDVVAVAHDFLGQDADDFFAKYVDANQELIPYAALLEHVGVTVEAEPSEAIVFLHPTPHASAGQLAGRRAWAGRL